MEQKTTSICLRLSVREKKALVHLAKFRRTTMADALRRVLWDAFQETKRWRRQPGGGYMDWGSRK